MNIHKYIKRKGFKKTDSILPIGIYLRDGYEKKYIIEKLSNILQMNSKQVISYNIFNLKYYNFFDELKSLKLTSYKYSLNNVNIYITFCGNSHLLFTDKAFDNLYTFKDQSNKDFNISKIIEILDSSSQREFAIDNILN